MPTTSPNLLAANGHEVLTPAEPVEAVDASSSLRDVIEDWRAYGKQIGIRSEEDVENILSGKLTLDQLQQKG